MDINNIQLDEKFDLIFSNAALHWIKDHGKLWDSVEKILNPWSTVRLSFAADGNCSNFFRVIKAAIALKEYKEYFSDFIFVSFWSGPPDKLAEVTI